MATDAHMEVLLNVRIRWRRLEHMKAHAMAQIRRAPKAERAAMFDRYGRVIAERCVIVTADTRHHGASRVLPGSQSTTGAMIADFDTFSGV